MGGLRTDMPFTFAAWGIGVLALGGIAPLSGFFSKDAILEAVWHSNPAAAVALFAASALTAAYAARATRLAFFGRARDGAHAHESGPSMLLPLAALAAPAAFAGALAGPIARSLGHEPEPLSVAISGAAVAMALVGGTAGWLASGGPGGDRRTAERLGRVRVWVADAYGWDRLVDRIVVRPVVWLCRALWAWGDRLVADGVVMSLSSMARSLAGTVRRAHVGDAQAYASTVAAAIALMLAATIWLGR